MNSVELSVVVPVFNEEQVIDECRRRLHSVLDAMMRTDSVAEVLLNGYEVIFVDDGSRDATAEKAHAIAARYSQVRVISLSRNFGHQAAITAGMEAAVGEAIVVIDADLQDPPELIPTMVERWRSGFEVVYAQRERRSGESLFKRLTAKLYYRLLNALSDVEIPLDTGDYRLIDRKVRDALMRLPERHRYVRGLVAWLGFRQCAVRFERHERFAGATKYPLRKMISFALDGLTSFSNKPLELAGTLGWLVSAGSFIYLVAVIGLKIFTNATVSGWASTVGVSLLLNGVVLIVLGIFGQYLGRIYDEVKARPLYVVREEERTDAGIAEPVAANR